MQPLVVIDITGGCVQAEYLYAGSGDPLLYVLDFDREGADSRELEHFAERVDEVCNEWSKRTLHPDDLEAIADYRAAAIHVRETARWLNERAIRNNKMRDEAAAINRINGNTEG